MGIWFIWRVDTRGENLELGQVEETQAESHVQSPNRFMESFCLCACTRTPLCEMQASHHFHSSCKSKLDLIWAIWLSWHDNWSPFWSSKGFCCLLRDCVCSNHTADGHEESSGLVSTEGESAQKGSYPKVAPEPIMYWPSVRITPFGPAPNLMILVVPLIVNLKSLPWTVGHGGIPNMKPIITPTAVNIKLAYL